MSWLNIIMVIMAIGKTGIIIFKMTIDYANLKKDLSALLLGGDTVILIYFLKHITGCLYQC